MSIHLPYKEHIICSLLEKLSLEFPWHLKEYINLLHQSNSL